MTDVFSCTEDNSAPEEIKQAGKDGRLMVRSDIGWIDLGDTYSGVKNNCEYKIRPRGDGFYWVDFEDDRHPAWWDGTNWVIGGMFIYPKNINENEIIE